MQSRRVRIDVATHEGLKRLAFEMGESVSGIVALAVRRLRQDRIGQQLARCPKADERAWLDPDLR